MRWVSLNCYSYFALSFFSCFVGQLNDTDDGDDGHTAFALPVTIHAEISSVQLEEDDQIECL